MTTATDREQVERAWLELRQGFQDTVAPAIRQHLTSPLAAEYPQSMRWLVVQSLIELAGSVALEFVNADATGRARARIRGLIDQLTRDVLAGEGPTRPH